MMDEIRMCGASLQVSGNSERIVGHPEVNLKDGKGRSPLRGPR